MQVRLNRFSEKVFNNTKNSEEKGTYDMGTSF